MDDSDTALYEHLEEAVEGMHRRGSYWREDAIPLDGITNVTYGSAREYERLAKSAVLLGAIRQSRAWFGEATRFYLEHIRAGRLQRDMQDLSNWEGEPRMFGGALYSALLSHDEEVLTEVATEALTMDDKTYLDAFADEFIDYPSIYYSVKIEAALVLEDERASQLLEQFRAELDRVGETSQYWELLPEYYRALIDGNVSAAKAATVELAEAHLEENPNPDSPDEYVLHDACAYVVLAQRYGVEITPESDRLPAALLTEAIPENDVELDVDLSDLQVMSKVGFFELERNDEEAPVIAARIYHPGGELVGTKDIPEREAGRVLSDVWIEAALDEAIGRDRHDQQLVADAKTVFEDGTLTRKLVVVQDQVDEFTIDESIGDSPIETVEFLKGAARL